MRFVSAWCFVVLTLIVLGCGGQKEEVLEGLPLKTWFERMQSEDALVRQDAVKIIGSLGVGAIRFEDEIREIARNDENFNVRREAVNTLIAMDAVVVEFNEFIEMYDDPFGFEPSEEDYINPEEEDFHGISGSDDLMYLKNLLEGTDSYTSESDTSIVPEDSDKLQEYTERKMSETTMTILNQLTNPMILSELLKGENQLEIEYAVKKLQEISGVNPSVVSALESLRVNSSENFKVEVEKALQNWKRN